MITAALPPNHTKDAQMSSALTSAAVGVTGGSAVAVSALGSSDGLMSAYLGGLALTAYGSFGIGLLFDPSGPLQAKAEFENNLNSATENLANGIAQGLVPILDLTPSQKTDVHNAATARIRELIAQAKVSGAKEIQIDVSDIIAKLSYVPQSKKDALAGFKSHFTHLSSAKECPTQQQLQDGLKRALSIVDSKAGSATGDDKKVLTQLAEKLRANAKQVATAEELQ